MAKKTKTSGGFDKRIVIAAAAVLVIAVVVMKGQAPPSEEPLVTSPEVKELEERMREVVGQAEQLSQGEMVTFPMVAYKYAYTPQSVQVKNGSLVKITIESKDADHGFVIDEFGVDTVVPAKGTVDVVFLADKVGTFDYSCGSHCPVGAHNMVGKLVVFP